MTTEADELEIDIRELRSAAPGELARRLVEKGWGRTADLEQRIGTLEDALAECLDDPVKLEDPQMDRP